MKPPRLRALGDSAQKVGWRFFVEGNDRHLPDTGADLSVIYSYKSQMQRRTVEPGKRAPFNQMGVNIVPPPWTMPGFFQEYVYRVWIKVFWYHPDGSIQLAEQHDLHEYRFVVDGEGWHWNQYGCDGRMGHVVYE